MLKTPLLLLTLAASLGAQSGRKAAAARGPVSDARAVWELTSGFVLRSAEMFPDSLYSYRPTPAVRTFGQMVAHVAGAQHMFCAMVLGEKASEEGDIEKSATTKEAIVKAMRESNAHCARAYAVSDAASGKRVNVFGTQRSKLFVLMLNGAHDDEHYGNIVTYMRINGMVPPSSMPAPTASR